MTKTTFKITVKGLAKLTNPFTIQKVNNYF